MQITFETRGGDHQVVRGEAQEIIGEIRSMLDRNRIHPAVAENMTVGVTVATCMKARRDMELCLESLRLPPVPKRRRSWWWCLPWLGLGAAWVGVLVFVAVEL